MATLADSLTECCRERVGDALRTVTSYDQDGFETVFVRDDVEQRYDERRFASLVAVARDLHRPLRLLQQGAQGLGEYGVTSHTFDEAMVVQLADEARGGYIVTLDRTADVDPSVARACVDALD